MAISTLQQKAFTTSMIFIDQVNGIVKQQALLKAEADSSGNANMLAQVIRSPDSYGFPSAVVADAAWSITYDPWAEDPKTADYEILAGVQKVFNLLTGYSLPSPQGMIMPTQSIQDEAPPPEEAPPP